jgi:hypothetical protein
MGGQVQPLCRPEVRPEASLASARANALLCWTDLAPESNLADVEPVAQEIGERASGEGDTADGPPIRERAYSGNDPALPKVGQQ